ncbi:MAG: RND transporter, partial [Myxococcales bacterium]
MASLLFRIGRWCADHAWRTIAMWLVVLVSLGGLASAFSTTPTSEVNFPGAKFQQVMDDLGQELPEVSGSISTAVFTTESGTFTPEQTKL